MCILIFINNFFLGLFLFIIWFFDKMNTAEILVKLLEEDGVRYIFGHPGEQILPFYKALKDSSIEHVLTRHEQAAAHASDAYARSLGEYGVCISTAGPGAMNLVMGVATAFKDSVPILVITGDNEYSQRGTDFFQTIPLNGVFENISFKSFHPANSDEAILNMVQSLEILHRNPKGPVHINLSKDVLLQEVDLEDLDYLENRKGKELFNPNFDDLSLNNSSDVGFILNLCLNKIINSKKPLILAGNGIVWAKACGKLKEFVSKTHIPIATTYHSKGVISEDDKFNLGLVGLRGSSLSNYAYKEADLILVLGAKLSERTISACDFDLVRDKIVHVNIDEDCLKGGINIHQDVSNFLDLLLSLDELSSYSTDDSWIDEIYSHFTPLVIEGIDEAEENYNPLKPQYVINKIFEAFKGSYFLADAGTHTTWSSLLSHNDKFGKFLFSGGFAPMGYSLCGSIGVAVAHDGEKVVVICGDGDIQMVIQELATIQEYDLNISIFILNNSQLGVIRQWEETIYNFDRYQVDLKNPDFARIAEAYGLGAMSVNSREELMAAIGEALNDGAYLVDVAVCEEDIPMPK